MSVFAGAASDEDDGDIELQPKQGGRRSMEITDDTYVDTSCANSWTISWWFTIPTILVGVVAGMLGMSAAWISRTVDPTTTLAMYGVELGFAGVGLGTMLIIKHRKYPKTKNGTAVYKDEHYVQQAEFFFGAFFVAAVAVALLNQWHVNFQSYEVYMQKIKVDQLSTQVLMTREDYLAIVFPATFMHAWLFSKFWAVFEREMHPFRNKG